jgi:hypothetical protein
MNWLQVYTDKERGSWSLILGRSQNLLAQFDIPEAH